ncbi:FYVE zinc finger-domain-containing protein [Pilaira anomala]|nr:FYVE zinc finger-domain-containing protein [Pilaira anomala]
MTENNPSPSVQNDTMVEDSSDLLESDIADAVPTLHLTQKPSIQQQEERLHSDSESEEDLTEEHALTTQLDNLRLDPTTTTTTTTTTIPATTATTTTTTSNSIHSITTEQTEESNAGTLLATEQQEQEAEDTINPLTPIHNSHMNTNHNSNSSSRGRSSSNVSPSTTVVGLLPRSQRVWEMDRQAPECRRCHRRFNFLVRRHHCRRCGQIVCDKCSSHRIRLPVEELIEDPMVSTSQYPLLASQAQRVCDSCYREPIRRSSESYTRRTRSTRPLAVGSQMRRSDSSQSLMIDCPVCGNTFLGMPKNEQEQHLQRCLNVGSPPVQSPRYIGKKKT